MTQILEKAFAEASKLPDTEQDAIAARLLEQLDAEQRWAELFAHPKSQELLEQLANEARSEMAQGKTVSLEDFLKQEELRDRLLDIK